jgi:agmatinase
VIRVLGIPYDASSSFTRGPAKGPDAILKALRSPSANMWSESGVDLGSAPWGDAGDIEFETPGGTVWSGEAQDALARDVERSLITERVSEELGAGNRLLSLGGDHSVTLPILRAYGKAFPGLTVVQLDAHADLYDSFEGDRFSHACPFARIMEEGLASRLIQLGVRTLTQGQATVRDRYGVETYCMTDAEPMMPSLTGPVYLSLDLDVLDPAFAPGVSHHEPGGLSTRAVLQLLKSLRGTLVGADIVELNPDRDIQNVTAMVAAKLAREVLAMLIASADA